MHIRPVHFGILSRLYANLKEEKPLIQKSVFNPIVLGWKFRPSHCWQQGWVQKNSCLLSWASSKYVREGERNERDKVFRVRRECWVCGWRTKWSLTRALMPTMCNTTTTTMMAPTTTTTSSLNKEKEERKVVDNKGAKGGKDKLLDKDWGAKIPDYISRSILSLLVFIMGLTMKVLCILVFALNWWDCFETQNFVLHYFELQCFLSYFSSKVHFSAFAPSMTLWMTILSARNKLFWCLLWRTRLARYCFDTQIFFAKLWFSIFSSNPPSSPAKRSTLLTISWLEGWLVAGACFEGPGEQGTRSGGIWGEGSATRWSGDMAATEIQRILFDSGKTLSKYFPTTTHCALFVNWF